ncbi:hypothetical protein [Opitutus terrae]|uniref:Alpha glucuronidase N-terminal domain-containing protein n=1 Tax=Opitutus terrae (strain DSM 11246 / JCM 15787 / PB90-1) TaxID=452637 RepID=B1ZN41_OPITP|nr:hypothetical protein [Opitutus terrae]ACB76493.1 hypothetical protein Oter_3213 [Opitutus terrae PB90-1]
MRLSLVLLFSFAFALVAPARTLSILEAPGLGAPARHGIAKFEAAVRAHGWQVEQISGIERASGDGIVCVGLGATLAAWPSVPKLASPLDQPEALAVKKFAIGSTPAALFAGADDRGVMYALLEAAASITAATDASDLFSAIGEVEERPTIRDRALSVYTMNRAYWESRFYDEAYWARYFDLLAADRFNRFLLIFGYENGGFLAPPYPYFFDTPGFPGVHMVDLTPELQHRNLAALNRLIALAHARGITVTLGIWDHIYRGGVQAGGAGWVDEFKGRSIPNSVEGVTKENLNAYTLASLRELLVRVPAVDALHFRIHEESGLTREEMEGFWRAVFANLQATKPGMLVELRGKGTPDVVIDTALQCGLNVRVETKYWMEQMGLPFHPMHVNPPDQHNRRHGYADFLRYPQRYQMTWRLWNGGTSRVLLWGDPDYVRRYGATTALYASPNWDVQEPLATKMEAQQPDQPTFDLLPEKYRYYDYEFERYWHFFQLWGRLGYNPATPPAVWQREFRRRFGNAATELETGLQQASQILPRIVASVYPYSGFPTTRGWAERQTLGGSLAEYADNEATDVALFESFADAATRILAGGATAKVTPDATSRWFDATADAVLASVRGAEAAIGDRRGKEFESTVTDLKILAQLARFHARRSLAAVHYNLFLQGHRQAELLAATAGEKEAIAAWRELVAIAGDRYAFDLAMGARDQNLCGHWRDELPVLEANLRQLDEQAHPADAVDHEAAWTPATSGDRTPPVVEHTRITTAPVGRPIRLVARATDPSGVRSLRLRYRHVTQYEDYESADLQPTGAPNEFAATIPGEFVGSTWDVMYFIEAIDGAGNGAIWPDFRREPPCVFVHLQR